MCHPTNGEDTPDVLPWRQNRLKIGKGPINHQFGWVCTVPDMPYYMFLDKDTGMCECYTGIAQLRDIKINEILDINNLL